MPLLVQHLLNLVTVLKATHAKRIPLHEGIHGLDWPCQFFDMESRCRITCKLEGLNRVFLDVYVLPYTCIDFIKLYSMILG